MKKLILTAMALFAIIIFAPGASAAQAFSQNIVGYTKVQLDSGFNLLGQQFVNVGDDTAFDIQNILISDNMPGITLGSISTKTELWIWNGIAYDVLYYIAEDLGGSYAGIKWVDILYGISPELVDAGMGFWIDTPSSSEITFVGQVYSETDTAVDVKSGFNLVANPYPMVYDIQNISSPDLPGITLGSIEPKTQLWSWNGMSYDIYYFIAEDLGGSYTGVKWVDILFAIPDKKIGIGKGFWIDTPSSGSLSFFRPEN